MAKNPWALPDGFDDTTKKAIRDLFGALRKSRTYITPEALNALKLGNLNAFANLVDWSGVRSEFSNLQTILSDQANRAALELYKTGGVGSQLTFDLINERAVEYARERAGELVVAIEEEMRETIRDIITRSTQGEFTVQQAGKFIRANLPLTPRDSNAVLSYADRQYFRFVRDGYSDLKARIKADAMAEKYADKLTRQRATTIARTETAKASMEGVFAGWRSGVETGLIDNSSQKEWIAEADACDICGPMDGKLVPWDSPFGSGVMSPPQHPNCRCSMAILPPDYTDSPFTGQVYNGNKVKVEFEYGNQIRKHLSGQHDQATHGRGGAKGPSSSQGKAPSTKYAAADYADVMDLLPEYDELDDALISYSGENYRKMNDYLRNDAPISNKLKNQVDLIQEELNKTSLPKPMEFTRGQNTLNGFNVTNDANGKLIFEKYEWIDGQDNPTMSIDSLVGQKWESKGFLSTSAPSYLGQDVRGAGFTAHPIQMKILAPAGTRGAGISSQEFEYLLPHGTSFEIVGASSIGGQVQLTMEVTN